MHARGFSLIEVVLTIGIVGAILIIFQSVLTSSALVRTTAFGDVALGVASSELENLRHGGYTALPASGAVADNALSALPSGSENLAVTDYNASTKKVVVTVGWVDPRGGARSIALTTLLTKVGGLP